jgi:hypothetical protein
LRENKTRNGVCTPRPQPGTWRERVRCSPPPPKTSERKRARVRSTYSVWVPAVASRGGAPRRKSHHHRQGCNGRGKWVRPTVRPPSSSQSPSPPLPCLARSAGVSTMLHRRAMAPTRPLPSTLLLLLLLPPMRTSWTRSCTRARHEVVKHQLQALLWLLWQRSRQRLGPRRRRLLTRRQLHCCLHRRTSSRQTCPQAVVGPRCFVEEICKTIQAKGVKECECDWFNGGVQMMWVAV